MPCSHLLNQAHLPSRWNQLKKPAGARWVLRRRNVSRSCRARLQSDRQRGRVHRAAVKSLGAALAGHQSETWHEELAASRRRRTDEGAGGGGHKGRINITEPNKFEHHPHKKDGGSTQTNDHLETLGKHIFLFSVEDQRNMLQVTLSKSPTTKRWWTRHVTPGKEIEQDVCGL